MPRDRKVNLEQIYHGGFSEKKVITRSSIIYHTTVKNDVSYPLLYTHMNSFTMQDAHRILKAQRWLDHNPVAE